MTIERPMFPPRAESVDSFSHQPAIGQPESANRTSESLERAQLPSAEVIQLAARRQSSKSGRDGLRDRERASKILKATATIVAGYSAYDGAWKVERTGDGLIAGSDGVVGERFVVGADKALARLPRLLGKVDEKTVMTVELRSVAAVAKFILERERSLGGGECVSLDDIQVNFLIAFADFVDRAGQERYEQECGSAVMTVDDLIVEAGRNRTGPMDSHYLSPPELSDSLRLVLWFLLEDLDYESEKGSGPAVAARALAALIICADEVAAKRLQ